MEADFDVAEMYIAKLDDDDKPNMARAKLLCEQCKAFKVLLMVQLALKLAVTFGAYIAMCGAGSGFGAESTTLKKLELKWGFRELLKVELIRIIGYIGFFRFY